MIKFFDKTEKVKQLNASEEREVTKCFFSKSWEVDRVPCGIEREATSADFEAHPKEYQAYLNTKLVVVTEVIEEKEQVNE